MILHVQDSPTAKGRTPVNGEKQWTMHFTLDDGSTLDLVMGAESFKAFRGFVLQNDMDDAIEEALDVRGGGPGV